MDDDKSAYEYSQLEYGSEYSEKSKLSEDSEYEVKDIILDLTVCKALLTINMDEVGDNDPYVVLKYHDKTVG